MPSRNGPADFHSSPSREAIRALPKAELHVHLDGSLRPSTMVDLAREQGVPLPSEDPEVLGRRMIAADASDLESYLERFALTLSVMQTPEALERIAYELAEDGALEGLRYMEVRFAPLLNVEQGLSHTEVVQAVAHGLQRANRDHGIEARIIICALRSLDPSSSLEMARTAAECRHLGVVAFDLAGGEAGNPPMAHMDAFRLAREAGLPLTIHAGEGAGAESIRQAVVLCGASRIGHGTRLREDPALLELMVERQIPLEVCPTSNVQTRVADSLAAHPVGEYLEAGIPVTLNTDNRMISGVDLTEEIAGTAEAQGWAGPQVRQVLRTAFEVAFVEEPVRARLLADFDQAVQAG